MGLASGVPAKSRFSNEADGGWWSQPFDFPTRYPSLFETEWRRKRDAARPEFTGVCRVGPLRASDRPKQSQSNPVIVESRCDAVVIGLAYPLPALSDAGASLASP